MSSRFSSIRPEFQPLLHEMCNEFVEFYINEKQVQAMRKKRQASSAVRPHYFVFFTCSFVQMFSSVVLVLKNERFEVDGMNIRSFEECPSFLFVLSIVNLETFPDSCNKRQDVTRPTRILAEQ